MILIDDDDTNSHPQYAASATGGNGFARDFLAGVAAMYSIPCKPSNHAEVARVSSIADVIHSLRGVSAPYARMAIHNPGRHRNLCNGSDLCLLLQG